jgi:hypothetical protein
MKLDVSVWANSIKKALLGALMLSSPVEGSVRWLTPKSFQTQSILPILNQTVDSDSKAKIQADSILFSEKQLSRFDEQGFLVVSGLLGDELNELVDAAEAFVSHSKKMKAYFSAVEMGMIFQTGSMYNETSTKAFRRVALDSILPQAAAELMRLGKDSSVRLLR